MISKRNWVFHYVTNNAPCSICGKEEKAFPKFICDAHTHGMYQYGHEEFQVVIDCGPQEVGRLLNAMGDEVKSGEKFKDGELVKGLYLDCDVRLQEMPDTNGKPLLRLIIPDKQNRWPENADYPYNLQSFATPLLYAMKDYNGEEASS